METENTSDTLSAAQVVAGYAIVAAALVSAVYICVTLTNDIVAVAENRRADRKYKKAHKND